MRRGRRPALNWILGLSFAVAMLFAMTIAVNADTDGSSVVDGTYWLMNTDGKFMAAGADWGTRGIVDDVGLDLTFTRNTDNGTYTINTGIDNGGGSTYLSDNLYMGFPAYEWCVEESENKYCIYSVNNEQRQYIGVQDDVLVYTDNPYYWSFITTQERVAKLAEATETSPVDATFLIPGYNFSRLDTRVSNWISTLTNYSKGGENSNYCAECKYGTGTLTQTLSDAPAGIYELTAQGFYQQNGGETENAPVFFANNKTVEIPVKTGSESSINDASQSFTAGSYVSEPIRVSVSEKGQLTVGVQITANNSQWVVFDNFRLSYLGAPVHEHSFATAWTTDATYHWHECTAEGNTAECLSDAGAARGEHVYGTEGDARFTCTTCSYVDADKKSAAEAADNQAVADSVIGKINAIGEVAYISESKGKIDAARAAYDALTDDQKALVTNYSTLTAAETTYDELKKAADDQTVADAVKELIAEIGDVAYTNESKAKIDAARVAYDALTDDQKALVPNLEKLTSAEEKYDELKKAAETPSAPQVTPTKPQVTPTRPAGPTEIIDLPTVKISKPKAAKKKITVKWKKVSKKNKKKIKGIEIQVATDSAFKNIVKTAKGSKKKTSKVIKGLKPKTKYYVRIRAYAAGNHYSVWKSKSVKVK